MKLGTEGLGRVILIIILMYTQLYSEITFAPLSLAKMTIYIHIYSFTSLCIKQAHNDVEVP